MVSGAPAHRVALVGFMGAGKSAVGRVLARRLRWRLLDFDREIERRAGRTVAEIFREEGEAAFRAREAEITAEAAGLEGVVLAPGGGWAAQPGLWDRLGSGTLFVWLRVTPATVLGRVAASPGKRPLLAGPDAGPTAERLLAEREPWYRRAELRVITDGRPVHAVAREVERAVLARGLLTTAFDRTFRR